MYPTALCNARFFCILPKIKFEIFAQAHQSHHDQNFVTMPHSKQQNSAEMLNFFPLVHIPSCQTPITVPASFPNILPYFQPSFIWRTSGNCLETLTAVNFSGFFRNSNKFSSSYCIPPPPLFTFFSLFSTSFCLSYLSSTVKHGYGLRCLKAFD